MLAGDAARVKKVRTKFVVAVGGGSRGVGCEMWWRRLLSLKMMLLLGV